MFLKLVTTNRLTSPYKFTKNIYSEIIKMIRCLICCVLSAAKVIIVEQTIVKSKERKNSVIILKQC